ncbi:hypothetical protein KFL_008200030 [Klebsormidium nitens]|uniref:Uncharacterized protein n=1 Tax=Klebsormidium nitens TaxID=105231 RepID=A0A1Y1IQ56_KLENI|nr:hypothetical protein KFL_008200030 [Klebsormidium nitens]|eukprot:GAQ91619.1 hypothetical protein KFL_008200030 [Klebsormidium nitens]
MPAVLVAPVVVQGVATAGLLAGGVLLKSFLDWEERQREQADYNRCPTCNGRGRVPCFCQRWSDGDVGCSTCAGSGEMQCNSCGGGGTGVPIPIKIRADEGTGSSSNGGYRIDRMSRFIRPSSSRGAAAGAVSGASVFSRGTGISSLRTDAQMGTATSMKTAARPASTRTVSAFPKK